MLHQDKVSTAETSDFLNLCFVMDRLMNNLVYVLSFLNTYILLSLQYVNVGHLIRKRKQHVT